MTMKMKIMIMMNLNNLLSIKKTKFLNLRQNRKILKKGKHSRETTDLSKWAENSDDDDYDTGKKKDKKGFALSPRKNKKSKKGEEDEPDRTSLESQSTKSSRDSIKVSLERPSTGKSEEISKWAEKSDSDDDWDKPTPRAFSSGSLSSTNSGKNSNESGKSSHSNLGSKESRTSKWVKSDSDSDNDRKTGSDDGDGTLADALNFDIKEVVFSKFEEDSDSWSDYETPRPTSSQLQSPPSQSAQQVVLQLKGNDSNEGEGPSARKVRKTREKKDSPRARPPKESTPKFIVSPIKKKEDSPEKVRRKKAGKKSKEKDGKKSSGKDSGKEKGKKDEPKSNKEIIKDKLNIALWQEESDSWGDEMDTNNDNTDKISSKNSDTNFGNINANANTIGNTSSNSKGNITNNQDKNQASSKAAALSPFVEKEDSDEEDWDFASGGFFSELTRKNFHSLTLV